MDFQINYYRQLAYRYNLQDHNEIASCRNIMCITDDPGTHSFYQLNANAELALGGQTRFMISGYKTMKRHLLASDDVNIGSEERRKLFHMKDYDPSYKELDALIFYGRNIGIKDAIKLRIQEILQGTDSLRAALKSNSVMDVYLTRRD